MKKFLVSLSSFFIFQLLITILSDRKTGGIFASFWNNLLGHPKGGLFIIFSAALSFIYLIILLFKYFIKKFKNNNSKISFSANPTISMSNDLNTNIETYNIDKENYGNKFSDLYKKFLGLNIYVRILAISFVIGLLLNVFNFGKPSVCDCNTVMVYGDGSVEAAKRILDYDAGENFMSAAQRQCGLKYWDEIDKWQEQKSKSLGFTMQGTPADNAMEFFNEKCNSK
jgi:hypothetical protein